MRAAAIAEPTPAADDTSVSEEAPAAAAAKKPSGAAGTTKAAKPSRTTKSAGSTKTTGGSNSAAAKTASAVKTTDAAKTASAAKTVDPAKTADAAKTTRATKSAGAAKSDDPAAVKSAATTEPDAAKSAGAAKTTKPADGKATKPAASKSTGAGRANRAAASESTAAKARSNGAAKTTTKTTAKTRTRKRTTARRPRLQYKVGQQLVYPLQGVGQVTTIEERPFRDDTLLYYVVYLEVSDMTIMVPVEKADELGIRAIVPKSEATGALRLIGEDYEPIPTDWKLRYQMNLDLLKAGSVSDIATVVRALYHRSRIKELPILERKLYDNARSLLVDELSFSLGKDKDAIQEMINARLEAGVKP